MTQMGHVSDKANEHDSLALFGEGALCLHFRELRPHLSIQGPSAIPFTLAAVEGFDLCELFQRVFGDYCSLEYFEHSGGDWGWLVCVCV